MGFDLVTVTSDEGLLAAGKADARKNPVARNFRICYSCGAIIS